MRVHLAALTATLTLLLALAGCDSKDCIGFDEQGRCIEAAKDTTSTGNGSTVDSGVISVPMVAALTADSRDIDCCEEFDRGCAFTTEIYTFRSRSADPAIAVDAASPFGAFLVDARAQIGADVTELVVTEVAIRVDPGATGVSAFEELFTDVRVVLSSSDLTATVGELSGVTGADANLPIGGEYKEQQDRWTPHFLAGDYTLVLDATTESAEYSTNCMSCPPTCTCDCRTFPDAFEMHVTVDLKFRAK